MKVLLMGRAGAGKTSMRSIIFASCVAKDTARLTPTTCVEHSHFRFLGNLVLSLWDCGGQDTFMENYFESQRDHIFSKVQVLIYVIEVRGVSTENGTKDTAKGRRSSQMRIHGIEKDFKYFRATAESITKLAPTAQVFCLLHKMDLMTPCRRSKVLKEYTAELGRHAPGIDLKVFGTSIWDETLFTAWSEIIHTLLPHSEILDTQLEKLCNILGADELILYERSTFLVLSRASAFDHPDPNRFEKISNICKEIKLTCSRSQASFSNFFVRLPYFRAFIERLTLNTIIVVIVSDEEVTTSSVLCNLDAARDVFNQLAQVMELGPSL